MKKYNLFSEVKISNIILIILGIGLCIVSGFIEKELQYTYLILTIFLLIIFIRDLKKYLNLKNNGKLIKDANYKIVYQNGKDYLKVFYKDNNMYYEIVGKLTFKSNRKTGKTDILINKKNPNEFYAFGPIK